MELNPIASWVLVIFFLVSALVGLIALLALAKALQMLNAKLEDLTSKVDPLLQKADQILTITNEKIVSIGDKTEGILIQGEETAENVHEKVDRTAVAVQRTVYAPIIGLNSFAAGVSRGVRTFGRLQRHQMDAPPAPAARPALEKESHPAADDGISSSSSSSNTGEIQQDNGRGPAEPVAIPAGKGQ